MEFNLRYRIKVFHFVWCLSCFIPLAQGQNDPKAELKVWLQSNAKQVYVISQAHYNRLSNGAKEEIDFMEAKIVFPGDYLTIEDVRKYERNKDPKRIEAQEQMKADWNQNPVGVWYEKAMTQEKEKVAEWVKNHPSVKLISQKEFDSFAEKDKHSLMKQGKVLIYQNQLTYRDILNFE